MTETIQKGGSEGSAARNQALFREVNERIAQTGGTVQVPSEGFICECAHEDCFQPIYLTVGEYEAVRAHPTHFFVAPGDDHFVPEAETVIHKEDSH